MPKSFAAEGLRKPGAATTPLVHLQVPPGMDAALRGLTREVLRRQPSDLYLFAHRYFESLLEARVAQQEGEEVKDTESLLSKKQSMRDFFQDDEAKRSREIVHRIHLENDSPPDKNVVHNINIEVEGEDASIEETTVKVEITGDEGKKKRRENRDTTSFEEEITTRTEHMTVCKSWKVETRVETSESGEIRVESFTNAGKTKQSSKPRKFASEEEKKSKSLIEEEKRAAKAQREKTKRESSKSSENVDKSASRELIMLERQADAQKSKTDEGKKYKSFVQLDDDSAADESERLIEIEREDVLTRPRRDVGDSTREVSPDGSMMPQTPQVALQKMEESLIQLKEMEAESLKRKEDVSKVLSEVADKKLHGLTSPEDALIKMERSLIELKETSLVSAAETSKEEISSDPEKDSLGEKQFTSIKSDGESKSSDISEEKHKIIENVKEIVHEIEEKASSVSSHIIETHTTEEKQSKDDFKSSEEKHKIIEDVKEVVHEIEEKAASVLSHIHGSKSAEEKQSLKSEDDSISEKRHKVIEDVKEVVQEVEEKTSSVLTHFPERTETSTENTDVDLNPDDQESIVVEALKETEAEKSSEPEKARSSSEKTEEQDANKESIAVDVQLMEEKVLKADKMKDKKTEVLDTSADDKVVEVEAHKEIEKDSDSEKVENVHKKEKDTELKLEGIVVEEDAGKQSPKPEKTESSAEVTDVSELKGTGSIVVAARMLAEETEEKLGKIKSSAKKSEDLDLKDCAVVEERMTADDAVEDTDEKIGKMESSAEKTEALDSKGKEDIVQEVRMKADDAVKVTQEKLEKVESSAEKTEALDLKDKKDTVEEVRIKVEEKDAKDGEENLEKMESSAEKTEALDSKDKEDIVQEVRMKADDAVKVTQEKLEKVESSAEKTEALDSKDKEDIVEDARIKAEDAKDEQEKLGKIESLAEETETLVLKGKVRTPEEGRMGADDVVDVAEETTGKIESPEKTEDLDLEGNKNIVVETRMKKDKIEDVEKERLEEKRSAKEAAGKKKQEDEVESKGRQKREIKATEIIDKGKDESASDEKPVPKHGESKEESPDGKLARQSFKKEEEKRTSSQSSKADEDKEGGDHEQTTIEGHEKKTEGKAHSVESTKREVKDDTAVSDGKELKGEQPQKRSADEPSEEESDKKEGLKEKASLLSNESDHQEAAKASERSEGVDVEAEEKDVDTVVGAELFDGKLIQDDSASKAESLGKGSDQLEEKLERGIDDSKTADKETQQAPGAESNVVKDPAAESTAVKGAAADSTAVKDAATYSTVFKDPASDSTVVKDLAAETTVKGAAAASTVVKNASADSTIVKDAAADSTVVKDAAADLTIIKDTAVDSTIVKDTAGDSIVVKDSVSETTVKGAAAASTTVKDTAVDSTVVEDAAAELTGVKDGDVDGCSPQELSVGKEAEPESEEKTVERESSQEKTAGKTVQEEEVKTESTTGESPSGEDTSQVVRVRRSTEETFSKTEEVSETISTSIMTQTILLGGPENEVKSMQTEVKERQEAKSQIKTYVAKTALVDIDDVFGHKLYPIEEVNTLLQTKKKEDDQGDGTAAEIEVKVEDSAKKTSEPVAESSGEVRAQDSVESSDGVEDSPAKSKEREGSNRGESSEENPRQKKLGSLDEESSSVSEGTGDGFLPPTVVISRVADVVELTDGEAKIVSQMEKEGLTTEYDENIKVRTGHWSAEDANKFLVGESQHTYHTLRKPELVYSDLHEARPPEKTSDESKNTVSDEPENSKEVETPSIEFVVKDQEESSPDKTDSLGPNSDSKEGPVEFSLVEVDDEGKEVKEDKPWLARAHTVEEIFEKETVGELIPVAPTPPRRSSVPGQVNVMMEMSKATSLVGQSILVLSGGEKRPVQRSDSDEYCISEDAIYIPLRPPGTEPDIAEESEDEPFRIDQPPPTFTYDSDEGEWGAALAEHVKKDPSLTTIIIERKLEDPSALGRVTITEITDEEEKAMSKEQAKESKVTTLEELPKPVFEIGSPVSDRNTDLSDVKHRPSLADISEENLESDNEGSMNVDLHISLSDGDNLSQRSYGTDSERKWTDDLSNVALKAKDAATGMIKNLFGSSPRKDRHSPARSESSTVSETSTDGGKRTRKRSESKEDSERKKEPEVVESKTKVERIMTKSSNSTDKDASDSSKKVVDTRSSSRSEQTGNDLPGEVTVDDKDKVTPRSLHQSSETSQSLTSVSLPLPDASYDLPNRTSSASTVDSPVDRKDVFRDDVPSDPSKPQVDRAYQMEESHRSKRSVEQEDVKKNQPDEKNEAEGSGNAAGTAVQHVAEAVQNEHDKADTGVSAKDQKEAGLAGQEPASEPKDSMTSVISETLDSVESLPSEVSKNLWSIEDVPLGENLNESDVQEDEQKGSEKNADEGSSKIKAGAVEEVLETIERKVEERSDDLRHKAGKRVARGVEDVEKAANEAKEDMRHKLARTAEVVEESLEDVGNERKKIGYKVEREMKDESEAIKGAITTPKNDIKSEIKGVQKSAKDAKEEVEKIGKNIKVEVDEGKAEVVEEGISKVGGMIEGVGEAISGAKEEVTSVFQEGEHRIEDFEEEASETVDEISAKTGENIRKAEDAVEQKVEKGKSGFGKFIGSVTDTISEVKENVSETVTHVTEDVKSVVSKSEKRIEKEVCDIKENVEEQTKIVEKGMEKKMDEAGKLKSEVVDDAEYTVLKETDEVKEIAKKTGEEVKEVKVKIREEEEKVKEAINAAVHEVPDKVQQTEEKIEGETNSKLAESISVTELQDVQKRLEDSIEREDDSIDTVDGTKETEIDQESKAKDVEDTATKEISSTRMVLDKRKGDDHKLEEVETSKVLARSIISPVNVASADDANTDSSGKEDSSEARRSKRHMLKRGVTLGDLPRSADTIPSESIDETSLDRADTVVHMTPDELEGNEPTCLEEEVVPIHVEPQEATPVPPGKDTKATETDLLEKETVSRGTEPEETSEQIAEALRSEVKDLEERLSRLRESTWSLSHAGPDSRKGEDDVHASKSHVDSDDVTERTVHVKKSISSAESMSFASRVLSTPMGSVREEFSEMKKSKAETTLETVLTVEKGVQSEGGEVGRGDTGTKTTVTTATQVSVPSNETSDDESRKATFQRAKSMDAKTEARAITNFSKRNSRKTVETKKADSSRSQQKKSVRHPTSVPPNCAQDFLADLQGKHDLAYLNAKATVIQAAYRGFRVRRDLLRNNMNIVHKKV